MGCFGNGLGVVLFFVFSSEIWVKFISSCFMICNNCECGEVYVFDYINCFDVFCSCEIYELCFDNLWFYVLIFVCKSICICIIFIVMCYL